MNNQKNITNKRKNFYKLFNYRIILFMALFISIKTVSACDVTSITGFYIGKTKSDAEGYNTSDFYKSPGGQFGFYVEWQANTPNTEDFEVRIYIGSQLVCMFNSAGDGSKHSSGTSYISSSVSPGLDQVVTVKICRKVGDSSSWNWCEYTGTTRYIDIVKVQLKFLNFSGTGNHTLKKYGSDTWTNDSIRTSGNTDVNIEWADTDLDGTLEADDPVCYTKDSTPKMDAIISISPTLSTPISAKIRIQKETATSPITLVTKDVSLSGSQISADNMTWSSSLPSTILSEDYTLTWSISFDGGSTYTDFGSSTTRFFVVYNTPIQYNSNIPANPPNGEVNTLTCKRLSVVLDAALDGIEPTADVDIIASQIQRWRDGACTDASEITAYTAVEYWAMLEGIRKGQCKEWSMLMEQAVRLLGIPAEWQHVYAANSSSVPVYSYASPTGGLIDRSHCGTTEYLWLYFPSFGPWNEGEGCCLVNGKLYDALAGQEIGWTNGVVDYGEEYGASRYVTAVSAAHHILLQLDKYQRIEGNNYLQRWRKANGYPCTNGDYYYIVPGAPTP